MYTNPYEDVDWEQTERHRAQFHLHEPRNVIDPGSETHGPLEDVEPARSSPAALIEKYHNAGYTTMAITEHEYYLDGTKHKGEGYFPALETTTWPWTRWECDPEELGMVAFQGAELRGTLPALDRRHDLVSLDTGLGHGQGRSIASLLEEIEADGGIAFVPHPGKYFDPDEWEAYTELFSGSSALLGVEIYNARDRYPDSRGIWDGLLTHFGRDRPVWAFGNDDYHAKPRPGGQERFDRSRTVLLPPDQTNAGVRTALERGRSYVQYDGEGVAPELEGVAVTESSIELDAPAATTVEWIGNGERIATGTSLDTDGIVAQYVRAELAGTKDARTCTQPFFSSETDC